MPAIVWRLAFFFSICMKHFACAQRLISLLLLYTLPCPPPPSLAGEIYGLKPWQQSPLAEAGGKDQYVWTVEVEATESKISSFSSSSQERPCPSLCTTRTRALSLCLLVLVMSAGCRSKGLSVGPNANGVRQDSFKKEKSISNECCCFM